MVNIVGVIPDDINALGFPIVPLQIDLAGVTGNSCTTINKFNRTITVNIKEQHVPAIQQILKDRRLILEN